MQCGRRGRVPAQVVIINDESGWRCHFIKVLNVDACELELVRQYVRY